MIWISVKDRLPELLLPNGTEVLAYRSGNFPGYSICTYRGKSGDIILWKTEYHHPGGIYAQDVTHWMPLPEAPEER